MQFTAALLSALAATSFATMLPRSEMGSWNVTVTRLSAANGFTSEKIKAQFVSDAYPAGIFSNCKTEHNPTVTPADSASCDNEAFKAEYNGQTIKVQQNVELPVKQTVFGEAPLSLTIDPAVGRSSTGNALIDVTSAIA